MDRKMHSRLIMLAGFALAAVAWALDSLVDYLTGTEGLTFVEIAFAPPLHAAFARTMLVITILAVSYASSSVIALLVRRRERIEHLNSALRSIHAVNQLVAREHEETSLLQNACSLLASGQGYEAAWIVRLGGDGEVLDFCSDGLDGAREAFEAALHSGDFPECIERAMRTDRVVLIAASDDQCAGCAMVGVEPESARVVAPIRHGERTEGYLCIAIPKQMASREEEARLVEEIASDLAMGLHSIRTERELARRDVLLADAERMASLGAWRWDMENDALHFSEEWRRIHGVEGEALDRKDLFEICHPDDREAVRLALDAALAGEGNYSIEHRIIRQTDEEVRWVDAQGEAVVDAGGDVVGFHGAAQDITERKLAEQRLRESRAELAAIYANAPVALMLVEPDRRVRKINTFAAGISGKPEEELAGLCGGEAVQCLHHLDDPRGCGFGSACRNCVVRQTVLDTFETGRRHHQVEATLPIGTEGAVRSMTFLLSTAILDHRETPLVLVTMEDITERKKAEQEVRELSRFREAVIDQANTAVVVFSPDGRALVWNRAVEEMTGYQAEEVMGQNAWDKVLGGEQHAGAIKEMLQAVVERRVDLRDVETRIQAADRTERLLSWDARMLSDDEGNPIGAVAMGRDITEQKELERKLHQSQRMEAIGRLAGGVAHDFNNMLTVITGNAELLESELTDPETRERLGDIKRAGERSAALTRQLLTFSRRARIEPTVFDLNAVVAETQSMLDRLIREHTSLELALDPREAPVKADRSQIEQVVMNLVVNARDAMPDGGTIRIETFREQICSDRAAASAVMEPGAHICLRVSDTGCGMDERTQARAFEPFFTTRDEGTGLGLATVYGIVRESGGEVEIDSTPGEGTVVTVCIPLTDEQIRGPEVAETQASAGKAEARVLLAEDEVQVRGLIEAILKSAGYETLSADGGESAWELFRSAEGTVDMLVTDVVMGGMGGVELAKRVRERDPDIPVLFMSGYTELELPERARLLQKPFMPDELLETVREVLEHSSE